MLKWNYMTLLSAKNYPNETKTMYDALEYIFHSFTL